MTTRQTDFQARRRGQPRNARRRILDAAHALLERKPWAETIAEPQEVARALKWTNERHLIAAFGRRPITAPATAAAALTTVRINTLYASHPAEGK